MAISFISSVELISNLKNAFIEGFEMYSSVKTSKYFVHSDNFDQRLNDVVNTIVGLMSVKGTIVTVNGDQYSKSEYKVPARLHDLIRCGSIYASPDAIDRAEPIFEVMKVQTSLNPMQFNRFFTDFNAGQFEGYPSLQLAEVAGRDAVTLEDVQYLEDEDGVMRKLHENGFEIELCSLLRLNIETLSPYLVGYNKPTQTEVAVWLFG